VTFTLIRMRGESVRPSTENLVTEEYSIGNVDVSKVSIVINNWKLRIVVALKPGCEIPFP